MSPSVFANSVSLAALWWSRFLRFQLESTVTPRAHRKRGKKKERKKSIALKRKALLVLPGHGRQIENKAVRTKAKFPLKARIPEAFSA